MRATYSPDDNKLRLYPAARLDDATYARVKASGFAWAGRQQLFVAPMWTPAREDLLLELCGEIGDEDTSLTERAEDRAERFEGYSDSRQAEGDAASSAAHAIASRIPLGQPIMVGHHSERRARKDADRIGAGLDRAVTAWKTADYWTHRAEASIAHAERQERPDVRARRIKTLEAEQRKQERYLLQDPGSTHHARWLAHLTNRLAYERALQVASGGTVADKSGPEKGGAVRCLFSPGYGKGWAYIRRVNKISVTIDDFPEYGTRAYPRTIPFDKLTAVMSAAEVDAARSDPSFRECPNGTGFYLTPAAKVA